MFLKSWNCIHSKLQTSLLRTIELKTWIFHVAEVFVSFKNSPMRLHVLMQSPSLFATSALLSNVYDSNVPKHAAVFWRGTRMLAAGPSKANLTDITR